MSGVGAGRFLKVANFLGPRRLGTGGEACWPRLRPQASGNGGEGEAGGCEFTNVAGS